MYFEVRMKNRMKLIVLRVLCILMIAAILWFMNLDFMRPTLMQSGAYMFFVGFIVIFLLFFLYSFYIQKRPRIEADGQQITFYPLWRPAKKVMLQDITSRKVKADTSSEQMDAAVGGMLLGGLFAYALSQRYADALHTPKEHAYTYYAGDTKLITVSTKNMENVERFDKMVTDKFEGKIPYTEPEMPVAELPVAELSVAEPPHGQPKPTKKTKFPTFPLIFTSLFGVICVVAIVATVVNILKPHTNTRSQSPNLLAGTSWIAGDDGSQWVFGTDNTFHWYQTKGKTDDNYFAGTYEFHIGQDALDYITTKLSRYGVTKKEILNVISGTPEYTLDNFVCFSCVNQSFMLNGREQLSKETVSSYFGFLLQNGTYLDIANMNTASYYGFTKE